MRMSDGNLGGFRGVFFVTLHFQGVSSWIVSRWGDIDCTDTALTLHKDYIYIYAGGFVNNILAGWGIFGCVVLVQCLCSVYVVLFWGNILDYR